MVEEGASERLDEMLIERRDLISRKDFLKYMRLNFERLSLRNIELLQEIILPIEEELMKEPLINFDQGFLLILKQEIGKDGIVNE